MKKIYLITLFATLLIIACNPNKDIYNDLDKLKTDYHDILTYTMTTADYSTFSSLALKNALTKWDSTLAKEIKTYASFGPNRNIVNYGTAANQFLSAKFLALKKGSVVYIKSDYSTSYNLKAPDANSSLPIAAGVEIYTLTAQDYIDAGLDSGYVRVSDMSILTDYIKSTICPNAIKDQFLVVNYKNSPSASVDGYFIYNGTIWSLDVAKSYVLVTADYDAMGAPGLYDNFSSSILPQNYLPTFLKIKYPYAQTNDAKILIYKYYAGSLQTHIATYTYDGSQWKERSSRIDQYVHNGEGWFYDPTIRFTMIASDYQIICDYVKNDPQKSTYFNKYYKNEEYWFGANAHYVEFDFKVSDRTGTYTFNGTVYQKDSLGTFTGKTIEENTITFNTRVKEGLKILLEAKYPTIQPLTSTGLQAYIEVKYNVYLVNSKPECAAKFKVIDVGKFEIDTYSDVICVP
jgi:hypothetical protein